MRDKLFPIFLSALILFSFKAQALEIDEKLTVRILSLSNSKKTVLTNRGIEDGLVVGDHAKFFLTTGVVARGVVVKASPSRSIWSFYRLVNPQDIEVDKVINLKISSPVKLTEDPTKMVAEIHSESEGGTEVLAVPVEKGDVSPSDMASKSEMSSSELDEMEEVKGKGIDKKQLEEEIPVITQKERKGINNQRTLEIWGLAHLNGLSTSVDTGVGASRSGRQSVMDFSLGIEKYFAEKANWLHRFSLNALLHNNIQELSGLENGDDMKQSSFEYGAGIHWHFLEDPFAFGSPILFTSFQFGFGNTTDSVTLVKTTTRAIYDESFTGSASFFSLGVGGKYYNQAGFGGRAVLDFYRRSEKYEVRNSAGTYAKVISGPRLMLGLSFRW